MKKRFFTRKICASHKLEMRLEAAQEWRIIMTQDERREYLIQYLLKEEIRFGRQKIPTDKQGQENLLRSLMNVRPPRPISNDFVKIQAEDH